MKKIYLFFSLLLITSLSFSQKDNSRYYNSWRLGLNIGGAWQTADYKSTAGVGGGFTLERGLLENKTNFFSLAIRGRYLAANTYGMDFNRNYDVKNNDAYNGTYDPKVNYFDSVPASRRYVYDNYKMTLGEGALELQLSFNRLRERTGVIFNLWGGVGFTSYRTKTDLIGTDGKLYNFSKVDSTGNQSKALSDYRSLIDRNYESYAKGSRNGNLVTFSPSAGIGLGYQFSPGFSMIWEYKITLPQGYNADLLDGRITANTSMINGSNDYYHYAGVNFLFTLRGKNRKTTSTNTQQNNETVYTNTISSTPTNSLVTNTEVPPTNTIVTTPIVKGPKPVINFITPNANGTSTAISPYKISAQILNVSSANQIQFSFNGVNYSNFVFNAQTQLLEFTTSLNPGSNEIHIIASNKNGVDDKMITLFYDQPKTVVSGVPPTVNITFPNVCPASSKVKNYNLTAQVKEVSKKENITVLINNNTITSFSYNELTGVVSLPFELQNGANTISVTGYNSFGTSTKTCVVNYSTPKTVTAPAPVISFIDPIQSGIIASTSNYNVKAQVLNVTSQNNITVQVNNQAIPFVFDVNTAQLTFNTALINGSNVITVSANNPVGADTKTTSITYLEKKGGGKKPNVALVNPSVNIASHDSSGYAYKLSVFYVGSKNDISVTYNGLTVSNFTYDVNTKELNFNGALNNGNNTLIVTGTNAVGSDSKTVTVVYSPKIKAKTPPVVTILNPINSSAFSLSSNYSFKATVANVPSVSGIVVKLNGAVVNQYSYDGFNLSYTGALNIGDNIFEVSATNADGSDSKNVKVTYNVRKAITPPIVTLVNPLTENNNTANALFGTKFSVLHVSSKNGIVVSLNNINQTNFTFDTVTKILDFNANLNNGNNIISVTGTNSYGSDTKTLSVNYTPKVKNKPAPTVVITNPATSVAGIFVPTYQFRATVTNVASTNELTVKLNGNAVSNYVFNNGDIVYDANLQIGNNTFEVTATNTAGTDSKSAIVKYSTRFVTPTPTPTIVTEVAPIVNHVVPAIASSTVSSQNYNFKFSLLNVASASNIEVTVNGSIINNFTYSPKSKEVNFNYALNPGKNTISVKGSNTVGSDSKQVDVTYIEPAPEVMPVIVLITNPAVANTTVQSSNFVFTATVGNVTSASNIVVKFNGAIVSNFNYAGTTVTYNANLSSGNNTFEVTASNSISSDSKSTSVNYKAPVVGRPPVVTILAPINTPTVSNLNYNFKFKATGVSQSQLQVTVNGNNITQFAMIQSVVSFNYPLQEGINTISVIATNSSGSDSKTAVVVYEKEKVPVNTNTTVTVPTNTVSTPTNTTTAPTNTNTSSDNGGKTMVICHIPPGNNNNPQTITISVNAWPAHSAHGDTPGACPSNTGKIQVNPNNPRTIKQTIQDVQDTIKQKINENQPRTIQRTPR